MLIRRSLIDLHIKWKERNYLSYIALLAALLATLFAQAQTTLTLAQAITNGLTTKKTNAASKLDLSISHLQMQAMYRKYGPQVSAEYTYLYNPILPTSILPIGVFNPNYPIDATLNVQFGTTWSQSAGITATQPLLDLSIQRHIREAKLQERIAALALEESEDELAFTIAQTYIDIYLQQAKIKSAIADTNRTFISYTLLQNQYDEKRLLKSDVNQAKINHNNAVQTLSDAIAVWIEDKVYLLYLMGITDLEQWDFAVDTTAINNYPVGNLVSTFNSNTWPDVARLTLQSELTQVQVQSERAKQLPTLNLKGYIGANQFSNTFDPAAAHSWFGLSYVGLDVKIPLLLGESPNNTVQQLKLQSMRYQLQQEDQTLFYTNAVSIAKLKMDQVKLQLLTQEKNIALHQESLAIFQARVDEGKETASNLNLEEINLQILKANYEANKKQLWIYWLDYLKASGQLAILWM